jgi:exopolysaccharide biosynthesis WecB/TagA/CpsF family protein
MVNAPRRVNCCVSICLFFLEKLFFIKNGMLRKKRSNFPRCFFQLFGTFDLMALGSVGECVMLVSGRSAEQAPVNLSGLSGPQATLARSLLGAARPASLLWSGDGNAARISRIFGLAIENTRLALAAQDMAQAATDGRRMRVSFVNAHAVNTAFNEPRYKATLSSADRIYADGSGMAVAARMCGMPLIDNVNGTDLFALLCRESLSTGGGVFLLGGKPGVAAAAAQTITDFGMGASIAGTHHGYFQHGSAEEDRVIGEINASGARIVLVGMGVPLQDQWAERNANRLDAPVIAGVGGLFDFFSGAVSRSPKFMRTIGCEWVWRLALEPQRMAYRYLVGNAIFLMHAWREARRLRATSVAGPVRLPSRQTDAKAR